LGTIDFQICLLFIGLKGTARKETWQTKNMVSVQVGDKDFANLTWSNRGFQNAILRSFSTVKEPNFVNLIQEFQGET